MKKLLLAAIAAAAFSAVASAAAAEVVVLDFDHLDGSVYESPLTYYAGGAGSAGTTGGPDYGISFSPTAVTGCNAPYVCSDAATNLAPSLPYNIGFYSGGPDIMNVAGGFDTSLSYFFTTVELGQYFTVWSGLNRTGTLLAFVELAPFSAMDDDCTAFACAFVERSTDFSGVAHSVDFSGAAEAVMFDNITLRLTAAGSSDVPEPAAWSLMIAGFGLAGAALRRRRPAERIGLATPAG